MEVVTRHRRRVSPRSRLDIMASILREAKRASRKTRIMYRCNLSYRQLKAYLELLVGEDFLKEVRLEASETIVQAFQITEKGRSFLKAYDNLREKFPRS